VTQIMIAREKHGPRYINMSQGIASTAHALLKERFEANWYEGVDLSRAGRALSGLDPKFTPWRFLTLRRDFEYEAVEIVDLEELT
jgi:hypothetical protein